MQPLTRAERAERQAQLEIVVGYLNKAMARDGVHYFHAPTTVEAALITAGLLDKHERIYHVTLGFAVTLDTSTGEATGDALRAILAENVEDMLSNIIGTEPLTSYIETVETLDDRRPTPAGAGAGASAQGAQEPSAIPQDASRSDSAAIPDEPSEADRAVDSARRGGYIVDPPGANRSALLYSFLTNELENLGDFDFSDATDPAPGTYKTTLLIDSGMGEDRDISSFEITITETVRKQL